MPVQFKLCIKDTSICKILTGLNMVVCYKGVHCSTRACMYSSSSVCDNSHSDTSIQFVNCYFSEEKRDGG